MSRNDGDQSKALVSHHLCIPCGATFAKSLPIQRSVHFCVDANHAKKEGNLYKEYQVISNGPDGMIHLCAADKVTGKREELTVRSDLIPEQSRHIGGTFKIGGSRLEVEIFERWF